MLMSYIGALKAWLHAPVFAVFGVSIETMRIPSIVVAAGSLFSFARLGELLFGRVTGLLLMLVLATDPAFFLSSRVDHGPMVLMTFFKAASLLLVFCWLREPTSLRLCGLVVALALGTFDKLNFIWFVVALTGALLIVYSRAVWRGVRSGGLVAVAAMLLGTVAFVVVVLKAVLPLYEGPGAAGGAAPMSLLLDRLQVVVQLAIGTLSGAMLWRRVLRLPDPLRPEWIPVVVACTALALAALVVLFLPERFAGEAARRLARVAVFFDLLMLLVFVQLLATPRATGPHHAFMLHPFLAFGAFAAGSALLALVPKSLRARAALIPLATIALVVLSQLRFDTAYARGLRDPEVISAWASVAIYPFAADLQRLDPDLALFADWGLQNQLFALAPSGRRARYQNIFFGLQLPELRAQTERWLGEQITAGKRVAVVLHSEHETYMPEARAHFLELERDGLLGRSSSWSVPDAAGIPLYEVHFFDQD